MRIVQLVENLEIGGLERIVIDLAKAEQLAGHEPSVVCLFQPGRLAPELAAHGIPVVSLQKKLGWSFDAVGRLRRTLEEGRADVLHSHNGVVHHYGVIAARLAGVPVVVNTRHGLGNVTAAKKQDLLYRCTMPWTDAVVTVSGDGRKFFTSSRGVPESKARVILNGIPLDKFHPAERTPGPVVRFGTIGRFIEAKDHATLLRAFALARKKLVPAELVIVGDGPLRGQTEALIGELDLGESVRLAGADTNVTKHLAEWDVFVFSSLSEGLPVVILEAMAMGLPVVSTRVGGVPEAAPESEVAWYSEIGDAEMLAEHLAEAAASPQQVRQRGRRARQIVEERFSVGHMASQYLRLFEQLRGS